MLPRTKPKKRISLENTLIFTDKDNKYRTEDETPLKQVFGLKKSKKHSNSRDSNNGKSVKSRSKPSSRIDDFNCKIFRTHNTKDESFIKKYPLGYYLPSTTGNSRIPHINPHESADFDSYMNKQNKKKHKLSLSSTGGYITEKNSKNIEKRRSNEKTPVNRLNLTCDLNCRIEGRSKSKSSKKNRCFSRADEEKEVMDLKRTGSGKRRTMTNSKSKKNQNGGGETRKEKRVRSESKSAEKLTRLYKKLCGVFESEKSHADNKLQDISGMFTQYVKLVDQINIRRLKKMREDDPEANSLKMSSKLLSFFCFYSQTNIESYIHTRVLAMKALKIIEGFIEKEKETLASYVPKFFNSTGQITIVDAVKMVKDFATSMIHENRMLTSYIKEHIDTSKIKDIAKKAFEEKSVNLMHASVDLDLKDLKNKLNESYHLKRETYNSTKTRPKGSDKPVRADEIPTEKQRTTFDVNSSSKRSRSSARDNFSNNHPISDMGNSAIMKFRNEDEYSNELNLPVRDNHKVIPGLKLDKYSSGEERNKDAQRPKHMDKSPSREEGEIESSYEDYANYYVPPHPTKHVIDDDEKGKNDLKQKLKLNIKKNEENVGFHEEFMNNFDQFSLSWRTKILQEKNAKHYVKNNKDN